MFHIHLNEIPEEGLNFIFNRQDGRLNEVLSDLISDSQYSFDVTLRKVNPHHELTGSFKADKTESCSRCGEDFALLLKGSIHEFIMQELEEPRGSQYVKPNHYSELSMTEGGPSITTISGNELNLGELLHEIVAHTEPFKPLCKTCESSQDQAFCFDEKMQENENSPFAALKKLKLKN